jgi:3-oxoacyl-[acyl-carrier-protein] synthase-3
VLETAVGGLGIALPERVVANAPIAERLGVDDEWIVSRTGIRERRYLNPGDTLADLATAAAERALQGVRPDLVIVATCSPDDLLPGVAVRVAERVGGRAGFDINAACTGFLAALQIAAGQLESGRAESVLVIGAEKLSQMLDPDDKGTAALFADGAGALLLTDTDGGPASGGPLRPSPRFRSRGRLRHPSRLGPVVLRSEDHRDLLYVPRDTGMVSMAGSEVFKHAVNRMTEATLAVLPELDADLYVYHQANARITKAVGRRLGLDPARVVDCVERYGNVSAASIPLALASAQPSPGDRILLSAFGAGFTWGAGVLTW